MLYKKHYIFSCERGITLIEILVSITLLSIIVVPFLGMFTQATKSNSSSKDILDATYVAQQCMEQVYGISVSENFMDGLNKLYSNEGYARLEITLDKDFMFTKEIEGYYATIEITTSGYADDLVKVLVKIYDTADVLSRKLEAQMETILLWEHTGA